jgi:hypothetical protein
MADEKRNPTVAEVLAELEKMKAEKALAEAELERFRGPSKPIPPAPRTSGTFTSTLPHYRAGRLYAAGEHITIENESPGRTWTRVGVDEPKKPAAPASPAGRPSDRSLT